MRRITEKNLIVMFIICSVLALIIIAISIVHKYVELTTARKKLKMQEKALKVIKQNLTDKFSIVHPTHKALKVYEHYGIIFKAKLEENNRVIVRNVYNLDGKIRYTDKEYDDYVIFVLEYIDSHFNYICE